MVMTVQQEEEEEEEVPAWLQMLVGKEFYESKTDNNKCEIHTSKYKTCFCINCNGYCFCPMDPIADAHQTHTTVQVYRVSEQASVDRKEFNKLWRHIEDIQPYKINGRGVILLSKNLKIKSKQNIHKQQQHPCIVCRHPITLDYTFCSINCKLTWDGCNNGADNSTRREVNDTVVLASPTNEDSMTSANSRRLKQKRIINKKPWRRGASKERIHRREPSVKVEMQDDVVNEPATQNRVVPMTQHKRKSTTPCRSPLM